MRGGVGGSSRRFLFLRARDLERYLTTFLRSRKISSECKPASGSLWNLSLPRSLRRFVKRD